MHQFRDLFPYDTIRAEQERAISEALDGLIEGNKRFAILELGTGVGKSGVGLTVGRYLDKYLEDLDKKAGTFPHENFSVGAYFVTTQKVLQDQYVKDFSGSNMKSVKASSNYSCSYHKKHNCAESRKLLKVEPAGTRFYNTCKFSCNYTKAKSDFLTSRESVTNFSYFMTEATYSGKVVPRNVLVVDEAHNIELELSKFIDVTITQNFAEKILKIPFEPGTTQLQAVKWIKSVYIPKVNGHISHIDNMLQKYNGLAEKIKEMLNLHKQIDMLRSHVDKINIFCDVYDEENWIMNEIPADGQSGRKIEFKVIDVSSFSERYLFRLGRKVVMMSATILNKDAFCESLGVSKDDVVFTSIPTPFPVENRPILFVPIGKMGKDNIDSTLPKLVEMIKTILENHPNEKGIIHAHTYKIANYIKKNVRSNRLVIHDSENREEILKKHIDSMKASVIISPSMTEGVDLKGDASRFQIVCKVPFPYLGDKLCRKRMNKWKWWYPLQTVKIVVQAVGRSIRTMDDHAVTYILDEDWRQFYSKSSDMFPESFRESIKELK